MFDYQKGNNTRCIYRSTIDLIHKVMKMKHSITLLDEKIKEQKTNTLKKPYRDEKKELKKNTTLRH